MSGLIVHATHRHQRAFTLVELLIAVAIVGVVATIALPSYSAYIERTYVGTAVSDIAEIGRRIKLYQQESGSLPSDLAQVNAAERKDPWGNFYVYVNLQAGGKGQGGAVANARKDKNLVPINSDFDLYSVGKDGKSQASLAARASRDDVVRASDGAFIGLASAFDP